MKRFTCLWFLFSVSATMLAQQKMLRISSGQLKDKIKGGWAGQTIGVTFGGPYEFRFNGSFIQDYQPLLWHDSLVKHNMLNNPGLYDDIYMDLTFVEVFERAGLDAPVDSFASAYAHAGYMLWHANQAGRYNILHGIKAPQSGHWINNPHADDIDFQIEADFAGLMSPAMPQTAASISDRIGHIMNYGDGWYGGVYMATLYSLAFTSGDVYYVVKEALKAIPPQSDFYRCIDDVIRWHKLFPNDWHRNWYEIQKKWSSETGCPDGVFNAFDIDAKLNAAYVVLGLLYGKGDFGVTMDIATRAGQDADCNPSSACGVLGTILGYDKIPEQWKRSLLLAEEIPFKYTSMSLRKTYETGYRQALENITRNGGSILGEQISIPVQTIRTVQLEKSFEGLYPVNKIARETEGLSSLDIEFEGDGIVLRGEALSKSSKTAIVEISVTIDGGQAQIIKLPADFTTRRHDIYWNYQLSSGKHILHWEVLNPSPGAVLKTWDYIIYKKNKQ